MSQLHTDVIIKKTLTGKKEFQFQQKSKTQNKNITKRHVSNSYSKKKKVLLLLGQMF